jgi:hypothetical protein
MDDEQADAILAQSRWTLGQTRTELWFAWVDIAIDAEARAVTARRVGRRSLRNAEALSKALERETVAAMVAVVAAGATLETTSKNLAQFRPHVDARGAADRFLRTAAAVFPRATIDDAFRTRVQEVFDLRNNTIHYASSWQDMTDHPIGVRTTQVAATYCVEAAERSVSTVIDALRRLAIPGLSYSQPAEMWAFYWRSLPDELEARRSRLGPRRRPSFG